MTIPSRSNLVAIIIAALSLAVVSVVVVQNLDQAHRLSRQNITVKSLAKSNASLSTDVHSLTDTVTKRQPTLNYLKCENARSRFTGQLKASADTALVHLISVVLNHNGTDPLTVAAAADYVAKNLLYDQALAVADTCVAPPSNP